MRGAVGEMWAPLLGGELARLTGERPVEGVTPDSLLALHDAGYRAVAGHVADGRILDLGCGQGFESVGLIGPGRSVVGVDYSADAVGHAAKIHTGSGLSVAQTDALRLCIASGTFDYVCSSHLIEHFERPEGHVSEMARVLKPGGKALILTPNAPADFENPFHIHLFDADELRSVLSAYFSDVWVGGLDATEAVKEDFRAPPRARGEGARPRRVRPAPPDAAVLVRRRLHPGPAARVQDHGAPRYGRCERHHRR